jgi:integrase
MELKEKKREYGSGQVLKVGNIWKIRYRNGSKRVQESAGRTRREATALLSRRLVEVADGKNPADSRLDWADVERTILNEHQQHRSFEKVERHIRRHLRPHFAGMRAQALTYDRLLTYKQARLDDGAAPNTVKYELSLVRTGLVVLHQASRLALLPAIPHVHVENTRTSFFEDDEFERLVKYLPAPVAAVAAFMFWTGWRRNEVLTREWRHVNFERGEIILEAGDTKSGEGRVFPFSALPALAELLKVQRAHADEVERRTGQIVRWVFNRDGKQIVSIRQSWRTACRKAALIGKIPHDFRRTAVRRLERAGVPRQVAMRLVGHRTEHMYQRYAITSASDLRDGLSKVVSMSPSKPILAITG